MIWILQWLDGAGVHNVRIDELNAAQTLMIALKAQTGATDIALFEDDGTKTTRAARFL